MEKQLCKLNCSYDKVSHALKDRLLREENLTLEKYTRLWGIIYQLPQHFMSYFSIIFIFSEFVYCNVKKNVSLLPKVQTFVTTPFQTTGGGNFTHNVRHGIFKWQ